MAWILLTGAIASEVVATSALKLSNGLTRPAPSVVVAVGYLWRLLNEELMDPAVSAKDSDSDEVGGSG